MRTTVRLDPDVAAAVELLQNAEHISQSAAVNRLARSGLERRADRGSGAKGFEQRSADLGLLIDVSDTAAALEFLEGPDHS